MTAIHQQVQRRLLPPMGRHQMPLQLQDGPVAAQPGRRRPRRPRRQGLASLLPAIMLPFFTHGAAAAPPGRPAAIAGSTGSSSTTSSPATATIPLARRRRQRQRQQGSGDKGQVARLRGFDIAYAYFASVEVMGPGDASVQAIDVLVDTGSSHLLLPTSLCDASSCVTEEGPVLQTLDLEAAGAAVVECDDPRCQGGCTHEMLASRGLLGRDGDTPDAVCGPFGGICQPASSAPYCLVFDSYADGSWAMGPLVTTPAIRLAGVGDGARVAAPLFAAVAEATPDFFESPQGGGIWGLAMGRELGQRGKGECGTPCLTPLLDRLWEEDGGRREKGHPSSPAPHNRFSIVGQGDGAALLIVGAGGEDPATAVYRDGSLRYVPLRQPWGYYIVGVTGLEIAAPPAAHDDDEGKDADASDDRSVDPQRRRPAAAAAAQYHEPAPGGRGAVLDSGTTGLFFSAGAFAFFRATLQARFCHVPYICLRSDGGTTAADKSGRAGQTPKTRLRAGQKRGAEDEDTAGATTARTIFDGDDAWVRFTEEDLAQLPTLSLLLHPERAGDAPVRLEVGPAKYLARIHDGEGTALYALSIGAVGDEEGGGDGSGYLLGQALLNDYFVEFDREGKRVGFAPAVVVEEG